MANLFSTFSKTIYDGTTIEVSISALRRPIYGVTSISFGTTLDTQKVYGAGNVFLGYTPGRIEAANGSLEIFQTELISWVEQLGGYAGFHQALFDITITYRNEGFPLQKIVLADCRMLSTNSTHNIGTSDNLTATLDFMVGDVLINDKGILGKIVSEVIGLIGDAGMNYLSSQF
jgi:hypothetical protein